MTFPSILYGVFLLSVCGVYWSVEQMWLRLWMLLVASLVFYSSLQPQYVPLLVAIAFVNFRLGCDLGTDVKRKDVPENVWRSGQPDWNRRRLVLLCFGIALNVLLLLGFKYIPFILTTVGTVADLPGAIASAQWISTNWIAPLGLSFFCFESIAYLIDVYRGAPASRQFLEYVTYKLFFPKLISGPITRYHQLSTQLKTLTFPTAEKIAEGLWLIAFGAAKKALIADRLGIFVDLSFDNLLRAGSVDLWLATFAYGLQLYLDFSGYVDIVRGSALLLGLNLPENFDYPYFSRSIADFWRRWHMTLGDWLRNYLYFPLGGSRLGLVRTCLNLLTIMLIAGIWHGAAWGFIVWGILHGLALVIHRLTEALSKRQESLQNWWQSIPGTLCAWGITQVMVFVSWIFFRLPNLRESTWAIAHLFGHSADPQYVQKVYLETMGLNPLQFGLLLWLLVGLMAIVYTVHRQLKLQLNWPLKLFLVPVCLYAVWQLAPQGGLPYIYFDF
ncbi:MBOAT family protein [Geitlerinema splendidum]|nr:MBOAT family protein [Geitlerinema splendidum]